MANDTNRLLDILVEKSFMYSEEPTFRLASGRMSSYYVNCKKTTYDPEGINLVGKAVYEKISGISPDGVGGLTLGADPIAIAAAAESFRRGKPIKAFVVRKTVKEHGTRVPIEGDMKPGEKVIVIEDVITTGGSALEAVRAAREFGLEVLGGGGACRRAGGGREAIEAEGLRVDTVITREAIMKRYMEPSG